MEQTKQQNIIAGILALVISLGVAVTPEIFDNELQDYFYCNNTGDISEFKGGVSGTGYSGYPFIDSRKGAVRCGVTEDKGTWIKLSKFASNNNLDVYDLLLAEEKPVNTIVPNSNKGAKKWICAIDGCKEIEG